ncbi:myb-like protein X [Lucilia sericata]|uniref:myb-like protein X n=1 Tax=Lucilia sericata TaxID=13632 RepID=UPI0018A851A9|nr:myb-like protein X [Lucilia sericata]
MESNLNEEKVTVQSLINSVPAASGGEQTGPQSSSSSDCTQPISEVGNLASVIENVSRSNENEEIVSTGQETDTYNSLNNETETAEISLQSETNKKDRESPLLVENNETHTTNVVNETEDSKENIEESSSQHEPNENDEESVASNLIQLEDTANSMNVAVGMEDSMESITHSQPDINSEKMITNSSTQIKDTAKKRLSGAQRRKLKKMAMKRQKRQAAQAINNNNNMNDSISMDDNTKSIKENTLQPEANKNDKESQSYNPIYNKAKSPLLAQTITNETITVDDNKESINESSLQAQPNENSEESVTNKDNTQVWINSSR